MVPEVISPSPRDFLFPGSRLLMAAVPGKLCNQTMAAGAEILFRQVPKYYLVIVGWVCRDHVMFQNKQCFTFSSISRLYAEELASLEFMPSTAYNHQATLTRARLTFMRFESAGGTVVTHLRSTRYKSRPAHS